MMFSGEKRNFNVFERYKENSYCLVDGYLESIMAKGDLANVSLWSDQTS